MHKRLVILGAVIVSVVILGLLSAACQVEPTPVPTPAGPAAAPTSPPPKAVQVTATPVPAPVAPATAPTSPPAKPAGELVLAVDEYGAEILDPLLGSSAAKLHLGLMYDYLVGMDRAGKSLDPTTGVAKRWEESANGLVWTFWLRDGIKFHNGEELTAEDVKFSVERNTSEKSRATNAYIGRNFAGIDVEDRYRLSIRLKQPDWTLPYWLSPFLPASEGMIYPKKYVTEKGDEYVAEHPVGSGPYIFEKWVSGNYITYKAIDRHWLLGAPKYDKVTFKLVQEESSRIAMLETGQAQVIVVSPAKALALKGKFNLLTKEGNTNTAVWFLQQWTKGNPLGNEKVREALGLALNKQEMLDGIQYGMGSLTGTHPVPVYSPAYLPLEPVPFDPEKAKRLLKEAGYGPGDLQLNIYVYARPGFAEQQKLSSEAAASYWENIGVKSRLITMDYAAYSPKWSGKTLDDPGVVVSHPFSTRFIPPFQNFWHSKGNFAMAIDPKLDALIDASLLAQGEKAYGGAAREVARYIREHFVVIPLLDIGTQLVTTKELSGWEIGIGGGKDFNIRSVVWR